MTVKKRMSRNEAGREEEKLSKAEHKDRRAGAEGPKACSGSWKGTLGGQKLDLELRQAVEAFISRSWDCESRKPN